MYQALYRKYRPRTFGDVTGQEHVTDTLRRQIVTGRLTHAYLFVGTRGTGKTTCAKILARAVNCLAPEEGEPCNKCVSCIGIENGSILDVLELEAASNNKVENVRDLLDEAIYSPASSKKRVYIVDEVQMYTGQAFNALLKTLEEPYDHLLFILATTELHKVPATIQSRCQSFSFRRLSPASIAERLGFVARSEGLDLSTEAADKLAALADGSMRDALSLLDQCASDTVVDLKRVLDTIGLAGQQELLRLASAIAGRDAVDALGILDELYDDGKDMAALLGETAGLMRDLLLCKLSPDSPLLSGSFSRAELSALSRGLPPERLFSCLDVIREASYSLSRGGSARLSTEMCLIRMCDERLSDDIPSLLARIARLEERPENAAPSAAPVNAYVPGATYNAPQPIALDTCSSAEDAGDAAISINDQASHGPEVEDEPHRQQQSDTTIDYRPSASSSAESSNPDETPNPQPSTLNARKPDGFWPDILELLKGDISIYMLLSDSESVQAELQGSTLIIRANSLFTVNTVESKNVSDLIRGAAFDVLGREVVLRVETASGSEPSGKADKLGDLRKFGIVKYE